jgi:Rieske Fe-S protein
MADGKWLMADERICEHCTIDTLRSTDSRRTFLVNAVRFTTVALAAFGLSGAVSLPVAEAAPISSTDTEKRYPIPPSDSVNIDRDAQVIVVRFQAKVYAFALSCPHQNTALRWLPKDMRFQCPKHESKYQPDGTFISGRATRNMDRFAVKKDGPALVVELNTWFQSDIQQADWAAAFVPA